MIEVHLYGRLRDLVAGSRPDEDTVMHCDYKEGERFADLLTRLGLEPKDVGDCFVNGILAKAEVVLQPNDRVGLFPFNMVLIDGGMHLKYHPHRR
jgi:hypothetical protein